MLALLFHLLLLVPGPQSVDLIVTTTGEATGKVHVAVFATPEDFASDASLTGTVQPFTQPSTKLALDLPAAGTYVFAAFQDLNGNGKLDTNFLGVPTEPYGFTRTPPSKWRSPSFGEVATEIGDGAAVARIQLKTWKEY
ncbi:DUF2141 domain-containing protein [Lewinella sp. 4G2]|uniref:DUF2141 domain-containing protein n=1 Tax=Lewinella sp. 4G2 TaxID=1803372 RepID=UPI0007B4E7EB|nr:DUF2141 domain-containing protein [Lewinella sp. 4G2]OAV43888.1 hypothetical protein A3850_004995 [Lewinella sp. 4G2]